MLDRAKQRHLQRAYMTASTAMTLARMSWSCTGSRVLDDPHASPADGVVPPSLTLLK